MTTTTRKAVLVLDVLPFECLTNTNLLAHLTASKEYFVVLWTAAFRHNHLHELPYDGHIWGLRNGVKPFRYLRMYLRRYHPSALKLPVVIVDFERYFRLSKYGYDLCIDITAMMVRQEYHNRQVHVLDTRRIFGDIAAFVVRYNSTANTLHHISAETLNSRQVVLSGRDIFAAGGEPAAKHMPVKQSIAPRKKFILVVGTAFFSVYHNVPCAKFVEFLQDAHLVVWLDNKLINRAQVAAFVNTLRDNRITVNCMLFGLDRNVKSIAHVRQYLAGTRLPFVLVDYLNNIYNGDDRLAALCDFDYYVNMQEYLSPDCTFYDMATIIAHIQTYVAGTVVVPVAPKHKLEITEVHDDAQQPPTEDPDVLRTIWPARRRKIK